MLKIWGRTSSINVQKVTWCAGELGLPFERRDAGLHFGVVDTPEYRAMNPNGLVPVIDDEGFVLWESNTIVRYLARKHGAGGLWPTTLQAQAEAERWMDWQQTALWPQLRRPFHQLVRTPQAKRDPGEIEAGRREAGRLLGYLDAALARRSFVAGPAFGVADVALGVTAYRWFELPIERPSQPSLERWYAALCARPAFREHVMLGLA